MTKGRNGHGKSDAQKAGEEQLRQLKEIARQQDEAIRRAEEALREGKK